MVIAASSCVGVMLAPSARPVAGACARCAAALARSSPSALTTATATTSAPASRKWRAHWPAPFYASASMRSLHVQSTLRQGGSTNVPNAQPSAAAAGARKKAKGRGKSGGGSAGSGAGGRSNLPAKDWSSLAPRKQDVRSSRPTNVSPPKAGAAPSKKPAPAPPKTKPKTKVFLPAVINVNNLTRLLGTKIRG